MIYRCMSNLIKNGRFEREDMTNKLNVFYMYNQITLEQYDELIQLVNPEVIADKKEEGTA